MDADDVIEARFGGEAKGLGAPARKRSRPARDNALDHGIGLVPDAANGGISGIQVDVPPRRPEQTKTVAGTPNSASNGNATSCTER